ncbi:Hypothetical protein PHPALM_2549 [Phytophthora palmivora]|uniref:Uncharacterized protein n=1 Tax=Phytophthora palmivora TaxID=4796 RepID=A0A2P4YPK7_9STRA|nr:Hypothetical protein PHPALM_2549 [Phytophthora palmivora]
MEITVASNSPLGQYLAELDADGDGGESLAQLLSARRPVASRKCPRRSDSVASGWGFCQLIQRVRRQIELMAIRNVIPVLCAFHPTIRCVELSFWLNF